MIITLVKKQTGKEFIQNMESTYNSISELEKTFKKTNNMKMYVDLENWRYYNNHLDETIELSESLITDKLNLNDLDFTILSTLNYHEL